MTHPRPRIVVADYGMVAHRFVRAATERGQIKPETVPEPVLLGSAMGMGAP